MCPECIRLARRAALLAACLVSFLSFQGCSQRDAVARITPPEDDAYAREFIFTLTRGGEVEQAYAKLVASAQNDAARKGLTELETLFGRGAVLKLETIGVNWRTTTTFQGKSTTTALTYQLEMNTGWFAGTVTLLTDEGGRHVFSARFDQVPGDLSVIHAFGAAPLTMSRILFLGLLVGVPVFCVVTMIVCFRSRIRRKVVWMIAIALPAVRITTNWTTGTIDFQPLSIQLLGSGFLRASDYAPWMFTVAIPIGAILFWGNRRELQRGTPTPPQPPPPAPPPLPVSPGNVA